MMELEISNSFEQSTYQKTPDHSMNFRWVLPVWDQIDISYVEEKTHKNIWKGKVGNLPVCVIKPWWTTPKVNTTPTWKQVSDQ